jgi:nitrate reductase NapAB chaperone NapD
MNILSNDQIAQLAPAVMSTEHKAGLSDHYTQIPTIQVVEDMRKLGWEPVQAIGVKARKGGNSAIKKHLVKFRNEGVYMADADGNVDSYIEVLLTNSHDGSSTFRFEIGIFRVVVKDQDLGTLKIRHQGYDFETLRSLIHTMVERLPDVVGRINKFNEIEISNELAGAFAAKAAELRFGDNLTEINTDQLLLVERQEDAGMSMWAILNRVQEKLVNGGFNYQNDKGKTRKARALKNFTQNIEFNSELWELADQYVSEYAEVA